MMTMKHWGALLTLVIAAGCGDEHSDEKVPAVATANSQAPKVLRTTFTDPGGLPAKASVPADFDGDGVADLAILNAPASPASGGVAAITVYRGPVAASGTGQVLESYLMSPSASDLAVADINGDGVMDLAIAIRSDEITPGRVHFILRAAAGTVLAENEVFSGFDTTDVLVADVNGDGRQDVIASDGANTLIALGAGSGRFGGPKPILDAAGPASGDFNGDARQDIVAVNAANPLRINVYAWNDSIGGPALVGSVLAVAPVSALAAADLNADASPDLVAATSHGVQTFTSVASFAFTAQGPLSATAVTHVAVADFNADGRQDIATADATPEHSIATLLAVGSGAYVSGFTLASSGGPTADLSVADVNGDGYDDIVASSSSAEVYHPWR